MRDLERALGSEILVAGGPPDAPLDDLFPEELAAVAMAIPRRQHEFATGRVLARRLLGELGHPPAPLERAEDRSPVWPDDAVGSITHTDGLCLVAAAPRHLVTALGLDAELAHPLEEELWEKVCTKTERSWLAGLPPEERGRAAKIVFSAKEAAYKCQYPLTREFLDFQEVELRLSGSAFHAELPARLPIPTQLAGFVIDAGRWVVTGACVKAASRPDAR